MKFQPGISGNPNGRPKGSLNNRTHYQHQLEQHAPKLIDILINKALNGEIDALKFCIERLIPKAADKGCEVLFPHLADDDPILQTSNPISKVVLESLSGETLPLIDLIKLISALDINETNKQMDMAETVKKLNQIKRIYSQY